MTEEDLIKKIEDAKFSQELKWVAELLTIRRERHRDHLEAEENPCTRGQAKECKNLLKYLSE